MGKTNIAQLDIKQVAYPCMGGDSLAEEFIFSRMHCSLRCCGTLARCPAIEEVDKV